MRSATRRVHPHEEDYSYLAHNALAGDIKVLGNLMRL